MKAGENVDVKPQQSFKPRHKRENGFCLCDYSTVNVQLRIIRNDHSLVVALKMGLQCTKKYTLSEQFYVW